MSVSVDKLYLNLREKLDILGYRQSLPMSAVPLVGVLFEDLIKTTESLRDAKLEIGKYLEEKNCWELGVEPYKCDNSRLLSESNALHQELIRQKDVFEDKICDYRQKIRNLESDRRHLEEHCAELEKNVRELLLKVSGTTKSNKNDVNMSRKPFVSTVKSGCYIPNLAATEPANAYRCAKCSSIMWTKHIEGKVQEVQLLQQQHQQQSQMDQVTCLKEKLERREREIARLNNLMAGGRPPDALAKDCCYKDVGTLSEDVDILQKEKIEFLKKYREAQDSMHEAMQRAIGLEEKNKELEKDLKDFEQIALKLETEANSDLLKKEEEISNLRKELEKTKSRVPDRDGGKHLDEKRKLHEQLNSLTQREKELTTELEKMRKKNLKLKAKVGIVEKDANSKNEGSQLVGNESETMRYKTERDFFQKEYLKMVEHSVSNKEAQMLRIQLEAKDNELNALMKELVQIRSQTPEESRSASCHSIQAAITRAERERDVTKEELKLVQIERDCLREKLERISELQASEKCRIEEDNRQLRNKIFKLESEKRDIMASHIPEKTQLTLIKEELEEMRKRVQQLQCENHQLSTKNNQLRILQDQTEKALIEYQNKLLAAETNLENAECQLSTFNTTRETTRHENSALVKEIMVLKSRNSALETEKDKIMCELDTKDERIYQLEQETKCVGKQNQELQCRVKNLERKLNDIANQKQEFECELHETSTERKSLRDQICSLKLARDEALVENRRITNELADVSANMTKVKHKLKESEKEVERLKQQLQQYVQEVQRVEELLLSKEQEREEMLEHYRSLSQDAVLLEGNNQSLEIEAAEQKQQLTDAQLEVANLRKELTAKDECISKLETQVSLLSSQICELQTEVEQNYDELKLAKVDTDASKELISKLDAQQDKLNAELQESRHIRCQLESEIEILQKRMREVDSNDRSQMISMEDLLKCTRKELEFQRKKTYELNQDIASLKQTITELEEKLCFERKKAEQNELLAKEYSVKVRELEQQLTDVRFKLARSKEDSPSKQKIKSPKPESPTKGRISPKTQNTYYEETESNHTNSSFMASFNAITKDFSPEQKMILKRDIKSFLNSKAPIKDSLHEYEEKVSLDEDTSDIIVRRKRTIKTKTSVADEAYNEKSKASKRSNRRSASKIPTKSAQSYEIAAKGNKPIDPDVSLKQKRNDSISPRSKSSLTKTSRSLSPSSILVSKETVTKATRNPKAKQEHMNLKQSTSDPETEYSKSLRMKTNHHFKGNLNFTTAFKVRLSPKKKEARESKVTVKKSSSDTKLNCIKKENKTEVYQSDLLSDFNEPSTGKASNANRNSLSDGEGNETAYPMSSTTDTVKTFSSTGLKDSPKIIEKVTSTNNAASLRKVETEASIDTNFHSVKPSVQEIESSKDKKNQMTIINLTRRVPEDKTCACMMNKKMHILNRCNVNLDLLANDSQHQSVYYRTYKLCRSPAGYNTESSSGFEKVSKPSPSHKCKKIDLSKVPPPPPSFCKDANS